MVDFGAYVPPHKWQEDPRDPLFTFEVDDQSFGIYLFSIQMWLELLAFIVVEALLAAAIGVLFYYTVVRHRGSTRSYIIGYAIFLPFWIFAPRFVLESLGIDNKIFRFCLCVITPTVDIFRTTEAIHGFTPAHALRSVSDFALYFGSPMILKFEPKSQKHVKATWSRCMAHLLRFVGFLFLTGAYQSLFPLFPGFFPSLGGTGVPPPEWFRWEAALDPMRWKDSALYGTLFQFYLTTFGEGLIFFTTLVTGIQTEPLMDNPMFESKSPSDFWGKRWNLLIHKSLKQGVYKPVRQQGGSKSLAILTAFVASGLFHEWLLPSVFFDYPNTHWRTTAFFAWQAGLVSLEALIGHWTVFLRMSQTLPGIVRTFLVVLAGIPLAHWFCESYVSSNFFLQGLVLEPVLLKIPTE